MPPQIEGGLKSRAAFIRGNTIIVKSFLSKDPHLLTRIELEPADRLKRKEQYISTRGNLAE